MRTIAYVDGYNLYYSLLRNTPYKWLDVVALVGEILRIQSPVSNLLQVKFFTAPVLANYARHGEESAAAQSAYLRALAHKHGARFHVIHGRHSPDKEWLPTVVDGKKLDRLAKSHVWQLSEKQTDVNLTLHMYRDVLLSNCEQVVLVSNDSDFEPLLKMLREETSARIGLIAPLSKTEGIPHRRPSVSLANHAHWLRSHVLAAELEAAQLKPVIPTNRKAIRKPAHW